MQRVGLVDGLSQIRLGPVVQLFDLIDFICVEEVFIAYLLEEPRRKIGELLATAINGALS